MLYDSEIKGQGRQYIVDLDGKELQWLNFLGKDDARKMEGEYELQKIEGSTAFIKYSAYQQPPQIYAVTFRNLDAPNLTELLKPENLQVKLLEELKFNLENDTEKEIQELV